MVLLVVVRRAAIARLFEETDLNRRSVAELFFLAILLGICVGAISTWLYDARGERAVLWSTIGIVGIFLIFSRRTMFPPRERIEIQAVLTYDGQNRRFVTLPNFGRAARRANRGLEFLVNNDESFRKLVEADASPGAHSVASRLIDFVEYAIIATLSERFALGWSRQTWRAGNVSTTSYRDVRRTIVRSNPLLREQNAIFERCEDTSTDSICDLPISFPRGAKLVLQERSSGHTKLDVRTRFVRIRFHVQALAWSKGIPFMSQFGDQQFTTIPGHHFGTFKPLFAIEIELVPVLSLLPMGSRQRAWVQDVVDCVASEFQFAPVPLDAYPFKPVADTQKQNR